ncbi:E3 ubiquitin-protein ligase synoviolin B [Ischnura elegans]|uniref:E3 ubiquitin-protein ligase synoviolin B n=1 Tax=Ischnura elegans TaxID=197161 RepID=UPI001ED8BCD7|nr:E3 ubiquitin-protein ligase synoviolin B [Ischnura elegans]
MRSLAYFTITSLSFLMTACVIGNAYYQKKQFYPSVVYITRSSPSMAVIYMQALVLVIVIGKIMRKFFFGQLRAAEYEHLMERSWYAVTETCLAFTVFRDDFTPKFVALFTVLLFLKSFHWLAEDRVDFLERSPFISWVFHLRVSILLALLGLLDEHFVEHAYQSTMSKGASVQLVFGFEYAILLTIMINITIKYILHTIDQTSENPWENKAVFLLYTELVMGFIKVVLYLTFVAIMIRLYTLPLFAFRPMYYTMRAFKKAFNDVILSRRAIQNMNSLYPDATPEELAAADNVCIICREEMVTASKKLPCNHIFHTSCLRSWFQRQQTCPTCRLNILRTAPATNNRPPVPGAAATQANAQQRMAGRPQAPNAGAPPGARPVFMNPFQVLAGGNGAAMPAPPFAFPMWPPFRQPQQQPMQPQGDGAGSSQADPNASSRPRSSTPQSGDPSQDGDAASRGSGSENASSSQNAGETGGTSESMPRSSPPFFYPPFPFVPFGVPPPPPPVGCLSGLPEEELRRLEMAGREGLEARLEALRTIQILLDAAVTAMGQYAAAVASADAGAQVRPPTQQANPETSSRAEEVKEDPTKDVRVNAGASTSSVPASSSGSSENASSAQSPSEPPLTQEQEEVRRRRLQKFAQATSEASE